MKFSVSLLNLNYVLLLALLPLLRLVWPKQHYVALLVLSTTVIIGLGSPTTLIIMSAIVVLLIYPLLWLHAVAIDRSWNPLVSASFVPAGVAVMVALLVIFKLQTELALTWAGGPRLTAEILALVGFWDFVFRAISILRISAILKLRERNPWVMLGYALFPATITSGPIQKYQDFREQVQNPVPLTRSLVLSAVYRITRGYFRKVCLALVLNAMAVSLLSASTFTVWTSVLVITVLYLYFYFDFAGYSDIAIGFGLLMGIKVPENFRKPFQATTVSEFWRNWHITLVDWLRDHVYIPLGGMKASRSRAAVLVFLLMMLCGLWHGLSINFVIWGAWQGAWLALEALSGAGPMPPNLRHGPKYWGRVLWTNARVAACSVLFLPDTATTLRVLHGFISLGG